MRQWSAAITRKKIASESTLEEGIVPHEALLKELTVNLIWHCSLICAKCDIVKFGLKQGEGESLAYTQFIGKCVEEGR